MTDHEKDLIYTPSEVSDLTLTEIARRSSDKTPGVPFGLPNVDSKMVPLRPGELIVLLGRPSMYKSGLAQWWARSIAEKQLATDDNRVVVYVTTEMAIEELGLYDLAVGARLDAGEIARGHISDEDMLALEKAGVHRSALPLWLLGHSLSRRRKRLSINMFSIEKSLYWVEDKMNFTARILFIDYLNLLDSVREPGHPPAADRRLAISDIVKCAKDMALNLGCPVVLLAQANRRVDEKDWKMPDMSDGMECVAGDTLIMDAISGRVRTVADWYGEGAPLTVHAKHGWELKPAQAQWIRQSGVRPLLKIITRGGRMIRVTANHPLFRDDGFAFAGSLKVGDWVAVARRLPVLASGELSIERAEFLGLMLGDGSYINGSTPTYMCGHDTILGEHIAEIAQREWGVRVALKEHSKYPGNYQANLSGPPNVGPGKNPLINWLREIGVYGQRHDNATVPEIVQTAPIESVRAFLRGYVTADGSFPAPRSSSHVNISFSSVSRPMLEQVRYLLLRCGLNSSLRVCGRKDASAQVIYSLRVSGRANVSRFMDEIGFSKSAKAERIRPIYEQARSIWTANRRDTELWPPSICLQAIEATKRFGIETGHGKRLTLNMVKGRAVSSTRLAHVGRVIDDPALVAMGEGDIAWDRIKSIEPDGEEMTYDLCVPDGHNFVASGLVTHNSASIEQYADKIFSIWYPKVSETNPTITAPNGKSYKITDHLLFFAMIKQKNGPAGGFWPLYVDPSTNEIAMLTEDDRFRY
jgi:replicative DNA helicase